MGPPVGDEDRLEQLTAGFSQQSGDIMDGCVLALDDFGVQINCPYMKEVVRKQDYRFVKAALHLFLQVVMLMED
jgi:hypothetical protein